jgi:hypothetical protein
LFDANNRQEFVNIFDSLTKNAKNDASFPILHIEAHGSSNLQGLVLQSGEFISWTELKPHLIGLNTATRLNLLVVFSLCHGGHFTRHLNPSGRAPCWGLVGPTKALSGSELLHSFSAFYKEVFASGSASAAIEKLNESSPQDDINYYFTTAASFFINVYKTCLEKHCTKTAYGNRARSLRKQISKTHPSRIPSIGQLRRKLESIQKDFFEKYKVRYFMIDLFPENANLFRVTYQDVIK